MPRPTTRAELLRAAEERYTKLRGFIEQMGAEECERDFDFGPGFARPEAHWRRDHNLRDVLVHLTAWHGLLLDWVQSNELGTPAPFLPAPYSWRNYAPMNVAFRDAHAQTALNDALVGLAASHARVIALIERFSDPELFEKHHYSWTGTTTLGSYCISATSSHYEWALKKLRAAHRAAQGRSAK